MIGGIFTYITNRTNIPANRPLTRYVKLRVAHAPGMPGTFSPPTWVSDSDMHNGTCITHVPWCMPGPLTIGFLWNQWRGKRSRHSRRMRNPPLCVSGKRLMHQSLVNRNIACIFHKRVFLSSMTWISPWISIPNVISHSMDSCQVLLCYAQSHVS